MKISGSSCRIYELRVRKVSVMETEFKFSLDSLSVFDRISGDEEISGMKIGDVETIEMHADYFDTPDYGLYKNGIGFRIRRENGRSIATVKWDVSTGDGLYKREEYNLNVKDEESARNPGIDLFASSNVYDVLREAAGDRSLVPAVSMDFLRRQFKVDTGKSISCISADEGEIRRIDGNIVPVCELEIEWYYGDEEDFMKLASFIRTKYGLESENASKLERAFRG